MKAYFKKSYQKMLGLCLALGMVFGIQAGTITVQPFPTVTATITFPDSVCLGQQFTITASFIATAPMAIGFWAALMPNPAITLGAATFASTAQTIGTFDPTATSPDPAADGIGAWVIG